MLLLKKKKYAAVTMEKKANGELVCHTELKGNPIFYLFHRKQKNISKCDQSFEIIQFK